MTDWRIDEIRRWHKLSLDRTSAHWRDVDVLLAALDTSDCGEAGDILADIECALNDARSALSASRHRKRLSRAEQPSLRPFAKAEGATP